MTRRSIWFREWRSRGSRVALASVEQAEDTNAIVEHAIDENIVGMDDHLTRVGQPAGPVGKRQFKRALGTFPNACLQPKRSAEVTLGDELEDGAKVAPGVSRPDELALHDAFR